MVAAYDLLELNRIPTFFDHTVEDIAVAAADNSISFDEFKSWFENHCRASHD